MRFGPILMQPASFLSFLAPARTRGDILFGGALMADREPQCFVASPDHTGTPPPGFGSGAPAACILP